jgi:hypothetical protein
MGHATGMRPISFFSSPIVLADEWLFLAGCASCRTTVLGNRIFSDRFPTTNLGDLISAPDPI